MLVAISKKHYMGKAWTHLVTRTMLQTTTSQGQALMIMDIQTDEPQVAPNRSLKCNDSSRNTAIHGTCKPGENWRQIRISVAPAEALPGGMPGRRLPAWRQVPAGAGR
jgi:hypothetical protein